MTPAHVAHGDERLRPLSARMCLLSWPNSRH